MATNKGTIEWFATELANSLKPLAQRLTSGEVLLLFEQLGVKFPSSPLSNGALMTELGNTVTACSLLPSKILAIEADLAGNNYIAAATNVQTIIQDVNSIITSFNDIKTALNGISPATLGLNNATERNALVQQIFDGLTDYLIVTHLEGYYPKMLAILQFAGIVELKFFPEVVGPPAQPSYVRKKLYLSKIGDLFSNPGQHFNNLYDWGDPIFDSNKLFDNLDELFLAFSFAADFDDTNTGSYELAHTLFSLRPSTVPITQGLELSLDKTLGTSFNTSIPFSSNGWELKAATEGNLQAGIILQMLPGGALKLQPPSGSFDALFSLSLEGKDIDPNKRFLILGKSGGSRMDAETVEIGVDSYFHWDSPATGKATGELGLHAAIKSGQIIIKPTGGDSFVQKLIPQNGFAFDFDMGLGWRSDIGFYFVGSGSLEVQLPIHFSTPVLSIDATYLVASFNTNALKIELSVDSTFKLGPFVAKISRIGFEVPLAFQPGNLGPLNAGLDFKPPTGLGLAMKSETIKGGGFLSFNKAEGRYVGVLELSIKDKISVKAIGILTTKLPGNQPGYSLLLLITAEFKPLQLGFGFTLNGVGGLIALHRRMNTQALRDGVRNGSIDNILFPTNPVENINSIISSLESVFPIEEGKFTFGPMAIIGWGTPTIITVELGLFFEVPNPQALAIIGVIRAILPDKDKPIIKLQIAFAGIIDFEKKFVTFDASLFDSSILFMTLSGDMAFRLKWGDQPTFVLTVGGFHPKFTIPQLNLPIMRRLSLNLCAGDNPRLTLSTYFAITSNTAQFGAEVDFFWKVTNNLKVYGYLGFDALFYFSPFRFTVTIQGGMEVKYKSKAIMSLTFVGVLEGPTPWHLQGSVTFNLLGIKKTVDFDSTFGQQKITTLEDVDVLPMLKDALRDKKNWQATMSTSMPLLVTVRDFASANPNDVVIHPQGTIAVNQKIVPLDLPIARFGNRRPSATKRFSLGINYSNTVPVTNLLQKSDLRDYFAPNEFFDLSEDERLARESFEQMKSGVQVSNTSNALSGGSYHEIQQEYELIYMDSRYKIVRAPINETITIAAKTALSGNGSAANSPLGSAHRGQSSVSPPTVHVSENQYVVAQTYNLAQYGTHIARSRTEAIVLMNQLIEANPELENKLDVIHTFELN